MIQTVQEEIFFDSVHRLATGAINSTMLELALQLKVFIKLKGKELSVEEFASLLEMPVLSARVLGQFLCREDLLRFSDGKLSNSPPVEKFLASDGKELRVIEWFLRPKLTLDQLKQRLFDPPPLFWYQLREQGTIEQSSLIPGQAQGDWLAAFFSNNNAWRVQWGEDLASRYDFSQHQLLLDIGGASGGWCIGIRKSNPHLQCIVFDLPNARESAEASIQKAGEDGMISFHEGSFFSDPLPEGADVALLANILHNWSPEDDRIILRKCFDSLKPGGTLLVKEYFFDESWHGPVHAVLDAFVMLGTEGKSGWQPTYGEVEELMREAGFTAFERRYDLVIGRKPWAAGAHRRPPSS